MGYINVAPFGSCIQSATTQIPALRSPTMTARPMASIAEEGKPPQAIKTGTYAGLASLVQELCQAYFHDGATIPKIIAEEA